MPVVRQRKHLEQKANELIEKFLVPQELIAHHCEVADLLDTVENGIIYCKGFKLIIILRDRGILR